MTDTVQIAEGAKLPSIPLHPVEDQKLRPIVDAVRGIFNTRVFGKDPLDRWVTWRDLIANNIVIYQNGNQSVVGSSDVFFPVGSDGTDFTAPPAPTGFTATSAVYSILLGWNDPAYSNYSYTEIWRSASNSLGTAVLLGTTQAFQFADIVGATSITYYYWIRFVSKTNVQGAYNSLTGTSASTGLVGGADLTNLIVTAQKLAAGAVETEKIANAAITEAKIANLAVGNAAIQNLAVTNAKIADLAIDSAKIANAAIVNAKIADAAITTAKINDAAITNAKIGSAAVQTANIQDGAITNAKIQDATITNAKINDSIQSNDFSSGSAGWRIQKSGNAEFNNATFRGTIDVKSSTSGARMEIKNSVIKVYDSSGVVRVKIGDLSA